MRVLAYSFLILFLELTLIRFTPGHVKATAYFANLTVIATFLGMGLGLLVAQRRPSSRVALLLPPALLVLLVTISVFANVHIDPLITNEEFFWPAGQMHPEVVRRLGMGQAVTILFALTALVFVPLGHGLGVELAAYPPLRGYTLDILGSLLGIASFGLASRLETPPALWFALGGVVLVALARSWPHRAALVALALMSAFLADHLDRADHARWSPYYKITLHPFEGGADGSEGSSRPLLFVNDGFHQMMVNMDPSFAQPEPMLRKFRRDYHSPYEHVGSRKRVLVIGAGTGNDVAVALLEGAQHVDAVEIDPLILAIGQREHPNRPYQDPRVTVHNTDGRVFLKHVKEPYDVVVYGTLDSHTAMAGQSNVRLDNYLYTREAFEDVRKALAPDGVLLLQILVSESYIGNKVFLLLTSAFGAAPLVLEYPKYTHFNRVFLIGPSLSGPDPLAAQQRLGEFERDLPRDDWPFLYLKTRQVPRFYRQVGAAVLVSALAGLALAGGRAAMREPRPVMLLLGAGFSLLETTSITAFSLLYGSTWLTNLFVFVAILTVILLANLTVMRFGSLPAIPLVVALLGTLLLRYGLATSDLLWASSMAREVCTVVLTGAPVLFASLLFARCFEAERSPATALGWNVLGAVLGGVIEYSSMVLGIRALYSIAAVIYLGVALLLTRAERATATVPTDGTPVPAG